MLRILRSLLSGDAVEAAKKHALDLARIGDKDGAKKALQPLRDTQANDPAATRALFHVVSQGGLAHNDARDILSEIATSHPDDINVLSAVADCLDKATDTRFLNAPPDEHAVFTTTLARLAETIGTLTDTPDEKHVLDGFSSGARIQGRQYDDLAERAYKRLVELDPNTAFRHYNLGLFYKTRGRFAEGVEANSKALELSGEGDEAYLWNLGICATGAGNGDVALGAWQRLGYKVEVGASGLPEGDYRSCKISVAEHPLAERTADNDDPGTEETIWVKRLSPCHGVIQSVLYARIGVDYGDTILFDGAPITYHQYDDWKVPVFPHLATLKRGDVQFFDFAGTQEEAKAIGQTSSRLPDDCVIYPHTENMSVLCQNCWNNTNTNHSKHDTMTKHVVTGRIAAPASIPPAELLRLIDDAIGTNCKLYAPDLCHAAGLPDRAQVEQHRYDMLVNN